MLKDRRTEILQSIPYAHQQNGRAERIIRTISEKAETMRLQACIPQSWWEFAVEHSTTGHHFVAIIGRPHTNSCMVKSHLLTISEYLVAGLMYSYLLKYEQTSLPPNQKS
jgi:hypothetical protein